MTQDPLPYYAPQIPSPLEPSHPRWPALVAWAVILVVAGFLILAAAKPEIRGRESNTGGVTDLQITVAAKNIVGVKSLAALVASSSTKPTTSTAELDAQLPALLAQVDSLALSPDQKLKAAVVAGEVKGSDEAIQRIESIQASSPPDNLQKDLADFHQLYAAGRDSLDESTKQSIAARYSYIGRLALTYGAAASEPARATVISEGRTVLLLNFVVLGGGLVAVALGCVLFVIAIVFYFTGSLRPAYRRQPGASTVYLEMFAVWLTSYVVVSLLLSLVVGKNPPLVVNWVVGVSLPLALGWGLFRGTNWNDLRQSLGWHSGRGWLIEIPMGLVGYIAGLPIIMIGLGITYVLIQHSSSKPSHPIVNAPTDSATGVLVLYSIASLFAPVIEETVFRGALFHHLRRRWNWPVSASIVAIIFAAIHPQGWALIPALASIAIVLAGIREWRGSLIGPITAHAFHNGMLVTLLVLSKA